MKGPGWRWVVCPWQRVVSAERTSDRSKVRLRLRGRRHVARCSSEDAVLTVLKPIIFDTSNKWIADDMSLNLSFVISIQA